ncbi:coiled-coil domain-containing protein 18 isoform X6 [Ailuropoda melanoleuca]|uniref:coiled-coil domain-containing protein 18 isoform X6 n=1 Tax=Ailuropoda melanoleuca TaxID=9646 RepID=UPI001494EAB7|nr:coiled-coil domain-containing protein 18 isoform X6 [Ailuropoda melanoleuca]
MESSSSYYCNKDNEEESLLANVASLRHELKITEWSLQSLGEELSSVSPSENSDYVSNHSRSEKLILEDLSQPNQLGLLNYIPYKKVCKMPTGSTDFPKKPRDKMSFSSSPMDQEIRNLREKLNKLRQQNACLVSQNHSLMTKMESVHFELTQSRAKVSKLESIQQQAASVPILEEQIINLEAEVSAQDKVLREAEDKLEQSQKMVIEKEQSLQKSQEECIKLKVDLLEQSKQGKRAERQRNEALYNAEELSKAFQHYKEKVAEKLEKVQVEEEILEKNLISCEKENKRLQEKCGLYKSDLEILKEKLRQLKEENNNGKEKLRIMAVKNSEVMAQLTESRQSILKLESELEDKEEVLREKFSLMNENRELKVRVAAQNERLDLCQQEIDSSRVELRSLEKVMSQLPLKREMFGFKSSLSKHQMNSLSNKEDNYIGCCEANKMVISELRIKLAIKEAEIQKLQANLAANQLSKSLLACNDKQESGKLNSLETEPVKLGDNQLAERIKDQNQHTVNKQYERERQRLASGIEELRTKLMQIEAENSDLKVNMAHRTSQFQLIQEELLEKASNSSKLESEMTKKCSQLLTLEKQLEEKIVAYSSIAAKNAELEQELMEKNEKVRSLETNINTEHEKICLAFEKAKKIHLEQHKEMEKQIERLESQLEKKDQQFKEQENTMSILQQDIICKQHHLESLDRLLTESKGEMEKENMKKDEALRTLQNQVSEETIKVRQLDSALEICKEELALHLNQLEGNKEKFEKQLKKKSEEVYCLQKELKIKNHSLQETAEQNVILQHTLQQQQQMLQQETIRNGELEDIQTKLEKQVSKLEQELQKQRESSAEKLRKMQEKCEAATHEADLKRQKVIELTGTARECKMENEDKKQELLEMDQALKERNWELKQRAAQVTHLDMTIREHRGEMEQKIIKLEGTLEKSELELKECNKQIESLNEKLQYSKEQLREKEFIMLQNEQEISQLKKENERTQQKMREMESVVKEQEQYIATQYKEAIDREQELRLTREQMQNSHAGLLEAHRQQVQAQREVERLSSELEEIKQLSKEKEAHGHHLAEELGASQVREAHLEARMQAEIKKLSTEVESLKEAYHLEMISHQENHAKWKISADSQKTSVQQLNEQLEKAKLELEEAQDTVSNLHQQVQDRNEVIEATNEALLIKESELTRLQAKISGRERAEDIKFLPALLTSATEITPDIQDPKFAKHSHTAFFKCRKLRRSISASDLSFKTRSDEDFSEELLQDLKKMQLEQPSTLEESQKDLTYTQSDSFKPLTYDLEDDSSESNDFSTLSGMLRYINKEVRLLKKSSMQTGAGLPQLQMAPNTVYV